MKLISWNVNGIRACITKGFEEFFKAVNADVFCIQETKCQEDQVDLKFDGYYSYWNSAEKKGYSGTAIFTKKEPINVTYGIGIEEHDKEVKYVDESSYRFLKKSSLYGGEVLLAKRGDIGKVYLFEAKTMYATLAPNLYLLKLNQEIDSNYLYYYLKSTNGQKALKDINASTSLGALYKEDVKNLYILYPSPEEQRAIAEALSDIDGLIAALDKKIAKKRLIKQGAMSKLLSLSNRGKKWFNTKLGCVVNIRKGSMLTSEEFIVGNVPVIAGGKTPAGYHNVANRPANTITISASGASAGFFNAD